MKSRLRTAIVWLLLPACADSCACGEQQAGTEPASAVQPPPPLDAGGPSPGASSASSGAREPEVLPEQLEALRTRLEPMPETKERKRLEKAAAAIDGERDLGDPIAAPKLAEALPKKVGAYVADEAVHSGTTPAMAGTATVAARSYRAGESVMNAKITDTADAPDLRRALAEQLTLLGNAPSGHQRGYLEGDVAGVLAYHEAARASRAMALVRGRFLVEVMVDKTESRDIAWSAIKALDEKPLTLKRNR